MGVNQNDQFLTSDESEAQSDLSDLLRVTEELLKFSPLGCKEV